MVTARSECSQLGLIGGLSTMHVKHAFCSTCRNSLVRSCPKCFTLHGLLRLTKLRFLNLYGCLMWLCDVKASHQSFTHILTMSNMVLVPFHCPYVECVSEFVGVNIQGVQKRSRYNICFVSISFLQETQ